MAAPHNRPISDTSSVRMPEAPSAPLKLDDFSCPLCLELLYKPCTIDCGHNVCQPW